MRLLHSMVWFALGLVAPTALDAQAPRSLTCGRQDLKDGYAEEPGCLDRARTLGAGVSRQGNLLTLRFENARPKGLLALESGCRAMVFEKCIVYRLAGYRPVERLYIVDQSLLEGGEMLVISQLTGKMAELYEHPSFSPSTRRFAAVERSDMGDRDRDISVWSWSHDGFKMEWSATGQPDVVYLDLSWVRDDLIRVKVFYPSLSEPREREVDLAFKDGRWSIDHPLEFMQGDKAKP